MANPHKKAGRSIQITSSLSADQLTSLCKDAAEQSKIRLDGAQPQHLLFSVRAMLMPSKQLMSFEVRLSASRDQRVLASRILDYTTIQSTILFIPIGSTRMPALPVYEKFMQRLRDLVEHADPDVAIAVTG